MSFFSKLFGDSRARAVEEIIAKVEKEVGAERAPLNNLALAIVTAATHCRDAVKHLIKIPDEKDRREREIYAFYEFIYFFMHMTMRHAFAAGMGEPEIGRLQNFLGPLVTTVAVDSYCAHWPVDLKKKMVSDIYEKLNDAELEYANIKPTGQGANLVEALLMKLGWNVSELSGNEKDLAVIVEVAGKAASELSRTNLPGLIAAAHSAA